MLDALQWVAERAITSYALPDGVAVSMINLSENATYRVQAADGRKWALRIHREGYHSKAAIASELAWLMDLRDASIVGSATAATSCRGRRRARWPAPSSPSGTVR